MTFENKHFEITALECKEDGGSRSFEGYGSIFNNVDSYGDIVMPGAFKRSLKDRKPKLLWQHRSDKPIGVFEDIKEDKNGLYVKGRFANIPLANDAYELLKSGAISGLSIGYSVVASSFDKKGMRNLEDVELYEVSLVTFPANEEANVMRVKFLNDLTIENLHEQKRILEAALRDAGASMSVAEYVAAQIKSPALRDAGGDLAALKSALDHNLTILRS